MRQLFLISLLSCALLAVGTASAKSSSKGKGGGKGISGTHQGTILAVNKNSITINIGVDRPENVTLKVDDKTAVTSGAQKGTIADLAKGQIVTVEIAKSYASKIDVTGAANAGS